MRARQNCCSLLLLLQKTATNPSTEALFKAIVFQFFAVYFIFSSIYVFVHIPPTSLVKEVARGSNYPLKRLMKVLFGLNFLVPSKKVIVKA